ncbi:type II secretion system protein, partial [bacterium]|nr:type II secretion system protein [bacterium]
ADFALEDKGALGLNTSVDAFLGSQNCGALGSNGSEDAQLGSENFRALEKRHSNSALNAGDTLSCHYEPTCRRSNPMTCNGFTLAEVLITLGIIGVVAALTIPTLMQKFDDRKATTAFKKFYSNINQALQLSEIDNGKISTWTINPPSPRLENGKQDYAQNSVNLINFFNTYLAPYLKYTEIIDGYVDESEDGGDNPYIYFADGSSMGMNNESDGILISFYAPQGRINNVTQRRSALLFQLRFPDNVAETQCGSKNMHFCPYNYTSCGTTREQKLANCETSGSCCTSLLLYDNWEFKEDYPR